LTDALSEPTGLRALRRAEAGGGYAGGGGLNPGGSEDPPRALKDALVIKVFDGSDSRSAGSIDGPVMVEEADGIESDSLPSPVGGIGGALINGAGTAPAEPVLPTA